MEEPGAEQHHALGRARNPSGAMASPDFPIPWAACSAQTSGSLPACCPATLAQGRNGPIAMSQSTLHSALPPASPLRTKLETKKVPLPHWVMGLMERIPPGKGRSREQGLPSSSGEGMWLMSQSGDSVSAQVGTHETKDCQTSQRAVWRHQARSATQNVLSAP